MKTSRRDFLKMGLGGIFGAVLSWAGMVGAEDQAQDKAAFEPFLNTIYGEFRDTEELGFNTTVVLDRDGRFICADTLPCAITDLPDEPHTGDPSWFDEYLYGWRLDILTDEEKQRAFLEFVYASYDGGESWEVTTLENFLEKPS